MNILLANNPAFLLSSAGSITNILSSPYTYWFPIVTIAAVMVLSILGLIIILAPLLGRNALVPWARMKVYEEFETVILALIFLAFAYLIYSVNPLGAFGAAGLVPSACSASGIVPTGNLYGLATCNIYTFNQHLQDTATGAYWLSYLSSYAPRFGAAIEPGGIGVSIGGTFSVDPNSIYLTPFIDLIFGGAILSFLQVVLLSASAVLFSFLIGIGLIARAFGIVRTFGNAMIALGIGIGFVYPLLVVITYGFINTTFSNILAATGTSALYLVQNIGYASVLSILPSLFSPTTVLSLTSGVGMQIWNIIGLLILLVSIVGVGIIFIPLLNFVILDAFVTDFSSSLGQQISFISMLNKMI